MTLNTCCQTTLAEAEDATVSAAIFTLHGERALLAQRPTPYFRLPFALPFDFFLASSPSERSSPRAVAFFLSLFFAFSSASLQSSPSSDRSSEASDSEASSLKSLSDSDSSSSNSEPGSKALSSEDSSSLPASLPFSPVCKKLPH